MNFVPHFNFYGVEAKQIPCIKGEGAPTTSTEGAVGCFYMDTLTGDVYKCTGVSDGVYTWAFSSLSVVQTTGDSETAVMSQKAVTDVINDSFLDIAELVNGSTTILEEATVCEPSSWNFGSDGFSDYIGVVPSSTYLLSFLSAPYAGTGQAHLVLHKYDTDYNELEASENDCEKTINNEAKMLLGFYRSGLEQHGKTLNLYAALFPNGGYREFATSEDCKYIRLEFLPVTSMERLPELTLTGAIETPTQMYEIKKDSINAKHLQKHVVSRNLFDKTTATTATEVYLGKDANGTEMYGWYLAGNGVAAVAQSGSGVNSTSRAIEVEGGETYYKPIGTTLNCFDENDNLIVVSPIFSMEAGAYTLPDNAKYVRIGFKSASIETLQFVKGKKPVPYDTFKYGVDKVATERYSALNEVLYRNALNGNHLPEYMKNIAEEAKKYIASNRHTFLFISDTHTTPITEYVGSLAANMTKYVPCSYIAHGGDIIDGVTDKVNELEILSSLARNFNDSQCPVFYVKGNHDWNLLYAKNNGYLADDYILNDELYCRTNRFYKQHIKGDLSNMYFFVDDEETKVRTIFLNIYNRPEDEADGAREGLASGNMSLSAEQIDWIASVALDFTDKGDEKNEWGVITVSHRIATAAFWGLVNACNTGSSYSGNMELYDGTIHSVAADYTTQGAVEFIASFVGDDHYDQLETNSTYGFPIIHILNASLARDNVNVPTETNGVLMPPAKTFGTENETAFDIVTINRESKLIYLTRYGARSYVYNENTASFDTRAARTRIVDYRNVTYTILT